MITAEYLRQILVYDRNCGTFTWKERPVTRIQDKTWNKKHAGKETGYVRHNGYKVIAISGKEYPCSRLAWLYEFGEWPNLEVDHIDRDKINNRISNLRLANRSQNAINRRLQSNNSSGLKGVWKRKNIDSWVAQIGLNGKTIRLGSFKSPEEAHKAYLLKAKEIHGEFFSNE